MWLTSCTDSANANLNVYCPCEVIEISVVQNHRLYYVRFKTIGESRSNFAFYTTHYYHIGEIIK